MAIALLPPAPQRSDAPDVYIAKADALVAALPQMVTDINTTSANLNAVAAGGAYALAFMWGTSLNGSIGFSGGGRIVSYSGDANSQPLIANITNLFVDSKDVTGVSVQALLSSTVFGNNSAIKGHIRLVKAGDPTKWARLSVTGYNINNSFYGYFAVNFIDASGTTPFVAGDTVLMLFQRTGDKGDTGPSGNASMLLLSSANITSTVANIDFLNLFSSAYDKYLLDFEGVALNTTAIPTFSFAKAGAVDSSSSFAFGSASATNSGSTSTSHLVCGSCTKFTGTLDILNVNDISTNARAVRSQAMYYSPSITTPNIGATDYASMYIASGAVSGFRLAASGASFTGGIVRVYGIKNT